MNDPHTWTSKKTRQTCYVCLSFWLCTKYGHHVFCLGIWNSKIYRWQNEEDLPIKNMRPKPHIPNNNAIKINIYYIRLQLPSTLGDVEGIKGVDIYDYRSMMNGGFCCHVWVETLWLVSIMVRGCNNGRLSLHKWCRRNKTWRHK